MGLVACALGSVGTAQATPIGPSCGTCQGSIYELTYDPTPVASTATTDTWRITYTIDTTGYGGGGSILNVVGLKVSDALVSSSLVSAPGGIAAWLELPGGVNSDGCSGAGSGFDCVFVVNLVSAPLVPGFVYEWVFDLEVESGQLFTDLDQATVKARYANGAGQKIGALVSEAITLEIPEPGAAALLCLGSLALARRRRG